MLRCLVIAACILLFLLLVLAALWAGFDWPPPRLILEYGFLPTGGPTGRTMTIEGVEFVELKPGYFRMGSWVRCNKGDALGRICKTFQLPWGNQPKEYGDEVPVRWVEVRQPYYIADSEVTNSLYERFDPRHLRDSPGDDDPVTRVSFDDVRAYCDWLAKKSGIPVRLPSEAEWENACRAGSTTEYAFGDDPAGLGEYAWFAECSDGRVHAVKTKRPNKWGLYDLHGNVWEWCEDTYHKNYRGAPEDARAWTEGGEVWWQGASPRRVDRGGGSDYFALSCRSTIRDGCAPGFRSRFLGFRPAAGPSVP